MAKAKKTSNRKKIEQSRKKVLNTPILWAGLILAILISSYFIYRAIHYYSAPEEIRMIRELPIYNYESDTLKIVDRREDYGGTDWKGVYRAPRVVIAYDGVDYDKCLADIEANLRSGEWGYSSADTLTFDNYVYRISVNKTDLTGAVCSVRVTSVN